MLTSWSGLCGGVVHFCGFTPTFRHRLVRNTQKNDMLMHVVFLCRNVIESNRGKISLDIYCASWAPIVFVIKPQQGNAC